MGLDVGVSVGVIVGTGDDVDVDFGNTTSWEMGPGVTVAVGLVMMMGPEVGLANGG